MAQWWAPKACQLNDCAGLYAAPCPTTCHTIHDLDGQQCNTTSCCITSFAAQTCSQHSPVSSRHAHAT